MNTITTNQEDYNFNEKVRIKKCVISAKMKITAINPADSTVALRQIVAYFYSNNHMVSKLGLSLVSEDKTNATDITNATILIENEKSVIRAEESVEPNVDFRNIDNISLVAKTIGSNIKTELFDITMTFDYEIEYSRSLYNSITETIEQSFYDKNIITYKIYS